MNRKLTPYYHHLLRKNDFYFLLSPYVGLQDLINNELTGKGDPVEGHLRQTLRRKGLANPIIYGTNIVPMKKLIEDRQRQINPEADDEVRAYLRRYGIESGPPKAKPPLDLTKIKLPENKKIKLALDQDEVEDPLDQNRPLTLQEQILNCLAGKGLNCIEEVSDFLARNGSSVPTPFGTTPTLKFY